MGKIAYQQAWDLQEKILSETVHLKRQIRKGELPPSPTSNYLLFCEHPPVYTLGKSGKMENLLLNEEQLREKGIEFFHINRGGDITFHGPGQIVGYPIFDLDNFKPDLHLYLRNIEEACILTCAEYGIEGGRIPGFTGTWLDTEGENPRKIMAIGVRCSMWVSMHGFAFNVNTDLNYFKNIIPCGIDDKAVTSLQQELGRELDMEEVKGRMLRNLETVFDAKIALS